MIAERPGIKVVYVTCILRFYYLERLYTKVCSQCSVKCQLNIGKDQTEHSADG